MALKVECRDKIIRVTASGVISWSDVLGMGEVIRELEVKHTPSPHRLLDLSGATGVDIDFAAVAAFASARNRDVLKNRVRVAVCAPTDMHFGIARMFQTLVTNPQIELKVFRTMKEAERWAAGV